ncbi:unnamed protein product [Camellia sinensis]
MRNLPLLMIIPTLNLRVVKGGSEEKLLFVYADGSICLGILQNQWSPIYDVAAILTSIQVVRLLILGEPPPIDLEDCALSLLCDLNPNSLANSKAARMFSENKREYNRRVREIVE